MEYQDKELICIECQQPFHFTVSEQAFYAEQGYAPLKCCPSCGSSGHLDQYADAL